MRYMITHMISGDAKKYHENLSRAVAQAYHLRPVTANIDPHLTVKAPFDALSSDLFEVERLIGRFVDAHSPVSYTLSGFGNFGDRVVYMDVTAPAEIVTAVEDFKSKLKKLPWLEFKPHEEDTKFHATLAYPKDEAQTKEMVERLNGGNAPLFTSTFDTIALLKKGERRWEVVREYHLLGSNIGDVVV